MAVEPNMTKRATTGDASAMTDDTATQTSAPRKFRLGYRAELDGVRGVAILCVFTYHFSSRRLPGGYIGVDIFFVLSGFLITYLLVEEWRRTGAINLKNFYARRALRLLPALFAWTLVLGVAGVFIGGETRRLIFYGIAASLSYVTNWLVAFELLLRNPLSITWSLAIEEQFYLLYPLALGWALRRKAKPSTLVVALCAIVFAVELRRALLWRAGAPVFRVYYATDTRADALMLGCLLGVLVSFELLPRAAWAKWAARVGSRVRAAPSIRRARSGVDEPETLRGRVHRHRARGDDRARHARPLSAARRRRVDASRAARLARSHLLRALPLALPAPLHPAKRVARYDHRQTHNCRARHPRRHALLLLHRATLPATKEEVLSTEY
jgi:hypothetical protein